MKVGFPIGFDGEEEKGEEDVDVGFVGTEVDRIEEGGKERLEVELIFRPFPPLDLFPRRPPCPFDRLLLPENPHHHLLPTFLSQPTCVSPRRPSTAHPDPDSS